jgi:hypothetical protein
MIAHRRPTTVQEPKQIVLSVAPLQPGHRVEAVLIAEKEQPATHVTFQRRACVRTSSFWVAKRSI